MEQGNVVTPCGSWQIDSFGIRIVAGEESATDTERTGTRDGLGNGNLGKQVNFVTRGTEEITHSVLVQGDTIGAVSQKSSTLSEFAETSNRKVLLVRLGGIDELISLDCRVSITSRP